MRAVAGRSRRGIVEIARTFIAGPRGRLAAVRYGCIVVPPVRLLSPTALTRSTRKAAMVNSLVREATGAWCSSKSNGGSCRVVVFETENDRAILTQGG